MSEIIYDANEAKDELISKSATKIDYALENCKINLNESAEFNRQLGSIINMMDGLSLAELSNKLDVFDHKLRLACN